MIDWQIIDTAPKSERVLIFTPHVGAETAILLESVDSEGKAKGNQWFVGQSMKNGGATHYKPTHWMPLPEPPTNEIEDGDSK